METIPAPACREKDPVAAAADQPFTPRPHAAHTAAPLSLVPKDRCVAPAQLVAGAAPAPMGGDQGAGGRARLRASRCLCANRPVSASTMDILSSVKKVVESRRWHSSRTTGPLPSDSRPESPGEPRVRPLAAPELRRPGPSPVPVRHFCLSSKRATGTGPGSEGVQRPCSQWTVWRAG